MHFELKSISEQSIPEALAKVERYRLLNEPSLAESICLDILAIVPNHQQALISLLLARTDQFDSDVHVKPHKRSWRELRATTSGPTTRASSGSVWEMRAFVMVKLEPAHPHHALREAMNHYEKAMNFAIPGNDDAILRWNTCARVIMQKPDLRSVP